MPNVNKSLYKVFLGFIKYIPSLLALVFISGTTCSYLKLSVPIIAYFGGVSFLFLVLLYLISWVFQFCHLYRIPLYYVTLGNVVGMLDKYGVLPFDNVIMCRIYFILTGIALIVYIWFMYKNRNKPKIDYIKQLCDNCC
jgi:hypothetical protein